MHDRITDIPFNESVELAEHDVQWELRFQREKDVLKRALEAAQIKEVVDFAHFGSTSIQGIKAKPIIGILCGVKEWSPSLDLIDIFIQEGYLFYGQMGRRKRYYFRKRTGEQFFNIHVVEHNKDVWKDNLLFRDFMNCFEFKRQEYQKVKEKAVIESEGELNSYGDIKYEYLRTTTEHANAWKEANYPQSYKKVKQMTLIRSQKQQARRIMRKKYKQFEKQFHQQYITELFKQEHPQVYKYDNLSTVQRYSSHIYAEKIDWNLQHNLDSFYHFWETFYDIEHFDFENML